MESAELRVVPNCMQRKQDEQTSGMMGCLHYCLHVIFWCNVQLLNRQITSLRATLLSQRTCVEPPGLVDALVGVAAEEVALRLFVTARSRNHQRQDLAELVSQSRY